MFNLSRNRQMKTKQKMMTLFLLVLMCIYVLILPGCTGHTNQNGQGTTKEQQQTQESQTEDKEGIKEDTSGQGSETQDEPLPVQVVNTELPLDYVEE